MIIEFTISVVFIVLVSINVLHWVGYLYSRYSKSMAMEREFIKAITKTASNIVDNYPKDIDKPDSPDEENKGYA